MRSFTSSDGFVVRVGRDAESNDRLTLSAAPDDLWLHVAGTEGSHVVVLNPERLPRLPRQTVREAAALAAHFSKARGGTAVSVHYTAARNVSKRRGLPRGTVELHAFDSVKVRGELPAGVEPLA